MAKKHKAPIAGLSELFEARSAFENANKAFLYKLEDTINAREGKNDRGWSR